MLLTVVAMAVGIVAIAMPANAAPPGSATITRSLYLATETSGGEVALPGPYSTSLPRTITLELGVYTFGYTLSGPRDVGKSLTIYLPVSGRYNWVCGLAGTGYSAAHGDNYSTACNLWGIDPNDDNQAFSIPVGNTGLSGQPVGSPDLWTLPAGTYSWQTYLSEG
ncbi:MAG TPA: hypothetical protein VHW44_13090 [Pseudonocardiaceae bacterium]|nr:hypothetical protein [Pseudonocardiaceae bacterium]